MDATLTIPAPPRVPAAPSATPGPQMADAAASSGAQSRADPTQILPVSQSQLGSVSEARLSIFSVTPDDVPVERILKPFGLAMLPYQPLDPAIGTGKEDEGDTGSAEPGVTNEKEAAPELKVAQPTATDVAADATNDGELPDLSEG